MFTKGLKMNRVVPLAALAAVLAISVAVAPSFAGSSFLTRQKAANVYLKQKEAHRVFLTVKQSRSFYKKSSINKQFLKQGDARKTYVSQEKLPTSLPVPATAASTVDFGPTQSTTAVPIPASTIAFTTNQLSIVTLTFSGSSTCTGTTNGVACPVDILVDGATTGKTPFQTVSTDTPAAKAVVNSYTTTSVVTPGDHTAALQYSGAADATLKFGLTDWNLAVNAVPIPPDAPDEARYKAEAIG